MARMPSTLSRAATKCISEVPGFEKQTSTPESTSVRTRLSAPFMIRNLHCYPFPASLRAGAGSLKQKQAGDTREHHATKNDDEDTGHFVDDAKKRVMHPVTEKTDKAGKARPPERRTGHDREHHRGRVAIISARTRKPRHTTEHGDEAQHGCGVGDGEEEGRYEDGRHRA